MLSTKRFRTAMKSRRAGKSETRTPAIRSEVSTAYSVWKDCNQTVSTWVVTGVMNAEG